MKLNHLFGAVAACGLLAGAAHAQSAAGSATSSPTASPSGAVNDTTAGGAGTMTTPNAAGGSGAAGMGPAVQSGSATAPGVTGAGADLGTASPPSAAPGAVSAATYGQGASVTVTTTTNGPIPDTPENRQKYGGPMSHAGRHTAARGN